MQNQTQIKRLLEKTITLLEDLKALKVKVIDIEHRSSIADFMIVAEGTSSRHVSSIANNISKKFKKNILSIEGLPQGDWALIDFGDIVLHIFRPEIRELYNLEKIWGSDAPLEKQRFGS